MQEAATRLQSDPKSDPVTGAMLGMGNGANGPSSNGRTAAELSPDDAVANAKSQRQSPPRKHS